PTGDHRAERPRTFFVFCCSLPGEAPRRGRGGRPSVSPRPRRRAGSRRCNVQVGDRVTDKSGVWQGLDNAAGRDTQVGTLDPIGPMIPEMRCSIRPLARAIVAVPLLAPPRSPMPNTLFADTGRPFAVVSGVRDTGGFHDPTFCS